MEFYFYYFLFFQSEPVVMEYCIVRFYYEFTCYDDAMLKNNTSDLQRFSLVQIDWNAMTIIIDKYKLTLRDEFNVLDFRLATFFFIDVQLADVEYGCQNAPYCVQLTIRKLQRVLHTGQQFVEILHVWLGLPPLVRKIAHHVPVPSVSFQVVLFEYLVGAGRFQKIVKHVEIFLAIVPKNMESILHNRVGSRL